MREISCIGKLIKILKDVDKRFLLTILLETIVFSVIPFVQLLLTNQSISMLTMGSNYKAYLLIPFLNRMYNTLNSKKEKQTLIFILIMLTSMVPLVNGKIIKQFYLPTYWTSIYPLTYFFVGKYIKDFQPQIKTHLNVIYLLLIIIIQGSIEYYVASGEVYKHFFTDYTSILRLIQGCLIFTLLYKANIKNEFMHKHITNISMLTLDIYLASFITDRIVYKEILKGFTFTQETYLYIMIPLIIASFALAYIIAIIRKKFIKLR